MPRRSEPPTVDGSPAKRAEPAQRESSPWPLKSLIPLGLRTAGVLLRALLERSTGFHLIHGAHLFLWRLFSISSLLLKRSNANARQGVLVVCPPGGGNIGDQALVESAAWNLEGPVTLAVRSESNYAIPQWLVGKKITTVPLVDLVYGVGFKHLRDVIRFFATAQRVISVVIIGADIMDGNYKTIASINRWSLAVLASRCGARVSVIGFSWNATPSESSKAGLLEAGKSAYLWVRDPTSLRRVEEAGALNARLCADIVFAHPAADGDLGLDKIPDDIAAQVRAYPEYVILNASGYIGDDQTVHSEYRSIVKMCQDAGVGVVLLPHVMRGSSDFDCLRRLRDACDGQLILVDRLLTPAQVTRLASEAKLVVTGRMHLAVLASMAGTPVLTLATQGKVDGLYDLLGRPDWVLDGHTDFSTTVNRAFAESNESGFDFPGDDALSRIRKLSRLPFN
ncbi:polysaccharide pyruvyl transferase family protein [Mycobacterium sp. IS-1742]|uniref:polysaccharide pyruvyl transferase family protein n=1 Tax=Mycobacterium sp. IS-1742 TaxID=1772285 RepID=UPI0009EA62CB|nr:polysaccharide pyruvyl transferase family protein [Mycobacterium sp. IS-1742]